MVDDDRNDLCMTKMPIEELRELLDGSPMRDVLKRAVREVLVKGIGCTAAAERNRVPPSTLHRACRGVLERRRVNGVRTGPVGAFEAWYEARCVKVPDTKNARGLLITHWANGTEMRADLARWETDCSVSHVLFGRLMRMAGHPGQVYRGSTRYPGVRLVDGVAVPRAPKALTQAEKEAANPELWHNGHPMRLSSGAMFTDPRTGKQFATDDDVRKYWDWHDWHEENTQITDPVTRKVLGTKLSLGMVKGRKSSGGAI